ncbi:hypothetical protein [Alicyclobacillus ferrooxydans]|uniref:hypothetical protein n=1 Tax=Alicyclobacillus ferrooxydans TaxID=471514 RepID=UPI0006D5AADF|nr:hypothetical protein [Alicyclobacillus ferrooxydans]
MKNRVQSVYVLLVEEPGDFTMEPRAVVIVLGNSQFRVYSVRAEHNRLRSVMNRHNWADLEAGIQAAGTHYRLQARTSDIIEKGWTSLEAIPEILSWLRELYPRHLFFLDQQIQALL